MSTKRIFISADHGLAIVYFLQSDVVSDLLNAGIEIVLLTDDGLKERISPLTLGKSAEVYADHAPFQGLESFCSVVARFSAACRRFEQD